MSGNAKQTAQPVTINLPSPSVPSGTQGAVLVLGVGLASVALWSDTLHPLLTSAWDGHPLKITLPASGILSLTLFVAALVFLSDLNPDFAQLAFWFVLALWVVWLVMHPDTVTTVTAWLSQGAQSAGAGSVSGSLGVVPPADASGGGGTHTVR